MGIVNVTPDSFSDGGRFLDVKAAIDHAVRLVREGAAIIDVGAESTRPGAERVPAMEQLRRALPVVRALTAEGVLVSIDTTLASVAEAAFECGAVAVNDVAAGTEDPRMLDVVARRGAAIVLMHRLHPPERDAYSDRYRAGERPAYGDVVRAVAGFLAERRRAAVATGVAPERIAIDPGLGFGKTVAQNYALVARIDELVRGGSPVLIGASRKSFLGAAAGGVPPDQRLPGSLAAISAAYLRGARLFRVHDVAASRQALAVAKEVVEAAVEGAGSGATIAFPPG
ncbi:MAG: dihydropteroate synthase [Phycisphaerales bacterium]|nr:dihydropteroate synthase [Phycisphaerales bacterium]